MNHKRKELLTIVLLIVPFTVSGLAQSTDPRGLTKMTVTYYDNMDLTDEKKTGVWKDTIDFTRQCWWSYQPHEDCKLVKELTSGSEYSVRWKGQLEVPVDGGYTFFFDRVDDGARLKIDGQEVMDKGWYVPPPDFLTSPQTVQLTKGTHEIIIDYKQGPPYIASLTVSWSGPTFWKEVIPNEIITDINVTYISRLPPINYTANPNTPQVDDDPATPQREDIVTWTAHVRNRGNHPVKNIKCLWEILDRTGNIEIKEGKPEVIEVLEVDKEVEVKLKLKYDLSKTHFIIFTADPDNEIDELSEKNNRIGVKADALMVGLWVEQSVYDFFEDHQYEFQLKYGINDGANSFEDWAQRHIRKWNAMFPSAVYPSAPSGGLDRVRLEKVVVVEDGKLPSGNHPDIADQTVDMMWGIRATLLGDPTFYDINNGSSKFNLENALIHELQHARFLVDAYGLDVRGKEIDVKDDSGKRIYRDSDDFVRINSVHDGITGSEKNTLKYSEWEINWLNVYAKQRPLPGWANYNNHWGSKEYMTLNPAYPANNILKIVDKYGNPLEGAEVLIYQAVDFPTPPPIPKDHYYPKFIDNTPDITKTTGADGEVALGPNPFSQNPIDGGNFYKCVNYIKIRYDGKEFNNDYWLDLPQVHVNYFRGNKDTAFYDFKVEDVVSKSPAGVIGILKHAVDVINSLPPSAFKRKKNKANLIKEINSVIDRVNANKYSRAAGILSNRILPKFDGCAAGGAVDKNDLIVDCSSQSQVYPLINEAIQILTGL
jgi:hypothetical protein